VFALGSYRFLNSSQWFIQYLMSVLFGTQFEFSQKTNSYVGINLEYNIRRRRRNMMAGAGDVDEI